MLFSAIYRHPWRFSAHRPQTHTLKLKKNPIRQAPLGKIRKNRGGMELPHEKGSPKIGVSHLEGAVCGERPQRRLPVKIVGDR